MSIEPGDAGEVRSDEENNPFWSNLISRSAESATAHEEMPFFLARNEIGRQDLTIMGRVIIFLG